MARPPFDSIISAVAELERDIIARTFEAGFRLAQERGPQEFSPVKPLLH